MAPIPHLLKSVLMGGLQTYLLKSVCKPGNKGIGLPCRFPPECGQGDQGKIKSEAQETLCIFHQEREMRRRGAAGLQTTDPCCLHYPQCICAASTAQSLGSCTAIWWLVEGCAWWLHCIVALSDGECFHTNGFHSKIKLGLAKKHCRNLFVIKNV